VAKIGFISLGCPKNLIDSEVMLGLIKKEGHILTTDARDAEVIIVNTCSFIGDSKRESIEAILEAARHKSDGSCQRLIVTGCLAERYPQEIRSDMVEVDAILGTNQVLQITQAIKGKAIPPPNSFGRSSGDFFLYDHTMLRELITPRYSAYMKIAEGCDHTCSFCIIPKIRGPYRSRTIDSLVREARQLAEKGVREITLVSQDTTCYGSDLGMPDGLAQLLEALDRVEGLAWIRFLYLYPNIIGNRLLEIVASSPKICKYIDMPLQHVSARVLKSMRRGGDRDSLTRLVEHVRRQIPGVTFRTTMIVGYPGETEENFEELKSFCKEMEFDRLGVFAYSDEDNTPAFDCAPKVAGTIANHRRRSLMTQQARIAGRKNRNLVGRELPVLIEGPSRESDLLLQGRLESQAPEIDGVCLINDSSIGEVKTGEFRTIRITRAIQHDLLGAVVR
jgi:ribosomal protein S12 methylthiotransferase